MRKSKKGFTLVEVLVVILISGLVLSMVAGAMIFVTNSSGDLIQQAEDIDMAKNIEKYVRNLAKENELSKLVTRNIGEEIENELFKIDESGNLIDKDNQRIFSDTGLTEFTINNDDGFIRCSMTFDSGKNFVFTLGIVPENNAGG